MTDSTAASECRTLLTSLDKHSALISGAPALLPRLQDLVAELDHLAQYNRYVEEGSSMFERLPLEVLQRIVTDVFASVKRPKRWERVSYAMALAVRRQKWQVRFHPVYREMPLRSKQSIRVGSLSRSRECLELLQETPALRACIRTLACPVAVAVKLLPELPELRSLAVRQLCQADAIGDAIGDLATAMQKLRAPIDTLELSMAPASAGRAELLCTCPWDCTAADIMGRDRSSVDRLLTHLPSLTSLTLTNCICTSLQRALVPALAGHTALVEVRMSLDSTTWDLPLGSGTMPAAPWSSLRSLTIEGPPLQYLFNLIALYGVAPYVENLAIRAAPVNGWTYSAPISGVRSPVDASRLQLPRCTTLTLDDASACALLRHLDCPVVTRLTVTTPSSHGWAEASKGLRAFVDAAKEALPTLRTLEMSRVSPLILWDWTWRDDFTPYAPTMTAAIARCTREWAARGLRLVVHDRDVLILD